MTDVPGGLAAVLAERYALERELGAGEMATVYLARDLKDLPVSIAVMHPPSDGARLATSVHAGRTSARSR